MTPKQKCDELIVSFSQWVNCWADAKQCALMSVDEIINSQALLTDAEAQLYDDLGDTQYLSYWEQVKSEIEKL